MEDYKLKNIYTKLKVNVKKGKKIIKFGDIDIEKQNFHQQKRPILIKNIDINNILVPNKVSFGKKSFKYFTGYKDAKRIRPLCLYVYFFRKWVRIEKTLMKLKIYLLIKDDELLGKYNGI